MLEVEQMHEQLYSDIRRPGCLRHFSHLLDEAAPGGRLSHEVFLYSRESWDYIKKSYRQRSSDPRDLRAR